MGGKVRATRAINARCEPYGQYKNQQDIIIRLNKNERFMEWQRIIITISLITLLFGCNPSENYLKNHEVFLYSKEIVQEKKYKISVKEANDLYVKYLYDRKKTKDLDYDETLLSPTLIIDDHYVYSFQNLVMQKVAIFGIWINANTGEITTNDESIWLKEKDIVSFKK